MQDILFSLLNQFTFENSILDPNCDGALPNELLQYAAEFIDIQILFPKRSDRRLDMLLLGPNRIYQS